MDFLCSSSWVITLVNIKNKQTQRPRGKIHVFGITFCSHISVLLYDVSFFASLKKALGFPRHKYCSNIRPGQMKPHSCEAFFVNTFWTIVIIVLIIEILRQSRLVVSQPSSRSHVPPWSEWGVTFYKFVISRVHFLRSPVRLQKVAGHL